MRLTKAQMEIVEFLQNGAWIWLSAGHPYIATNYDGRIRSKPMNAKVFRTMCEHGIIVPTEGGKWLLPS